MKPKLAFANDPQFTEHVFAAEQWARPASLSCGLKPLLEPTSPEAQAVLAETERERLGTLVVDEVERFVRHAPLLHRVPHELLGQLA